jgi:thioredoxin-like negative regulator of GroEL
MRLIYFFSKRPGPCVLQNVIVDNIQKIFRDLEIQRVDFDSEKEIAKKYNIPEAPSIILEKGGRELTRFLGLTQETFLKRAIENNLT